VIRTLPGRAGLALSISLAILLFLLPPTSSTVASGQQNVPTTAAEREHAQKLSNLRDIRRHTADLLARIATSPGETTGTKQMLVDAAAGFESLASAELLRDDLRKELREAAQSLRKSAQQKPSPAFLDPFVALLKRVGTQLDSDPLADLAFQGSYSQTKVAEPVYGGHGTAMGPPPEARNTEGKVASPVQFEDVRCIEVKTYCGGRTKDHILESGGSGVAVFDFDGDGWLDAYVVNAFELSDTRERIPHRNALFRNLGGWKFHDVSAGSGVDVAAWGSGVCVGDYDEDGRLDRYVTNFGPNFLFRNNGKGVFTDTASKAGVQAGGWSTGCAFFDADGDGDLDLYVARYVSTSRNDLSSAQRTLTWRGGPKTMIGPIGLPGEADLFFENRGDGTFVEATDAHGLTDRARAYGFGVVATDYDGDGWIDQVESRGRGSALMFRSGDQPSASWAAGRRDSNRHRGIISSPALLAIDIPRSEPNVRATHSTRRVCLPRHFFRALQQEITFYYKVI
jgi:hypothetical protein